jgi:translation initiation factor IF-3
LTDDYSRYFFERQQAEKAERKLARRRRVPTKEIHLSVEIASRDFDTKVARARSLLASRLNLRVSVDHVEPSQEALATAVLERFVEQVGDAADGVMPAQRGERELVAVLWTD